MDRWDLIDNAGDAGAEPILEAQPETVQITQVIVTNPEVVIPLPDITSIPTMQDQDQSPIRRHWSLIWRIAASGILAFLIAFLIMLFVNNEQAISIKRHMLHKNIIVAEKLAGIDKKRAMESIHETQNWIAETNFSNEDKEWLVDLEVFKHELEAYSIALEGGVLHGFVPSRIECTPPTGILIGTTLGFIICIVMVIVLWGSYIENRNLS